MFLLIFSDRHFYLVYLVHLPGDKQRQACYDASMAQATPDTTLLPDPSGQGVKQQAAVREGGEANVVGVKHGEDRPASDHQAENSSTQTPRPQTPPPRPSLVPLGSVPSQSSTLTPVAPHPKRFNAVNISKKFLKTASGSSATSSSSPSVTKSGSSVGKLNQPPILFFFFVCPDNYDSSPTLRSTNLVTLKIGNYQTHRQSCCRFVYSRLVTTILRCPIPGHRCQFSE